MTTTFEGLSAGDAIDGPKFAVSRESTPLFGDASLDYNPLQLDDDYMKGNFGKTNFGGIIMHGMNNFGLISRNDHRLGLSGRRRSPPPGDSLGQAGPARRHHPAPWNHQVETGDPKFPLGPDRRHGAQPE